MIHGLNWAKFNQQAHEAYAERTDKWNIYSC
jgi:hypothetical protein